MAQNCFFSLQILSFILFTSLSYFFEKLQLYIDNVKWIYEIFHLHEKPIKWSISSWYPNWISKSTHYIFNIMFYFLRGKKTCVMHSFAMIKSYSIICGYFWHWHPFRIVLFFIYVCMPINLYLTNDKMLTAASISFFLLKI